MEVCTPTISSKHKNRSSRNFELWCPPEWNPIATTAKAENPEAKGVY